MAPDIVEELGSDQEGSRRQPHSPKIIQRKNTYDSLDIESGNVHGYNQNHGFKDVNWAIIFRLAFQSLGIVYGDLGTSPLYVLPSTFNDGIKHVDDILGVYSLIFYTLTLLPMVKYVFIVMRATDNGDGGTFALYSLICRYAKVSLIPSQQAEDHNVSNFQIELPSRRLKWASALKSQLEKSQFAKYFLLLGTMLGTSMLIGDGILTPCISVLSAVGGIKQATPALTQDMVVWISVAILIFLFMIQRFGTDKVGYSFAPIMIVWFGLIGGIGLYNFIRFDPLILKALNPAYIVSYFKRNKKDAWISLGDTILCVTGAEALFADVGHFTVLSIQISTCSIVYPAILLAYTGQAAFLRKHQQFGADAFYKSVPGTFSVIQQSLSLGCFPRVKVIRTSTKYQGQVYIPEVNYLLMLACVAVTLGFRTTVKIGNAYGNPLASSLTY
ncbi:potassium transporter [Corchorus olitorius]|uniref:Potassium transporter n=1 Tax=Corchorus olitorius TaxID=93759 RepID=A0A1R3KD65_9ROSI|nr:potassium transporter [Corchorus olitorius]